MSLKGLSFFDVLGSFMFIGLSVVNLFLRRLMDLLNWSLLFLLFNDLHYSGLIISQQVLIIFTISVVLMIILVKFSKLIQNHTVFEAVIVVIVRVRLLLHGYPHWVSKI
jgi:hypothetical protein